MILDDIDPNRPGIEYMVYAFAQALTPQFLVTPSVLLKLDQVTLLDITANCPPELSRAIAEGREPDEALAELNLARGGWQQLIAPQDHTYFLQASQTIGERNLFKILESSPAFQSDPTTMGWQALFSLLTSPGDGKADNYSVDENGNLVIGIDNDKIFYPNLYRDGSKLYSGINCVFYLLDSLMDGVLPDEVRKPFLDLNPAAIVLQWLGLLQGQNKRYQRLADLGILKPQDLRALGLPICLSTGLPEQLMNQMIQLQERLQDHPTSTPQQLLYSFHPAIANYYQALREGHYKNDPLGAMWVIYKGWDKTGTLQTVDKVLGLSSHDSVWQQSQKNRVTPLNDDLISCLKSFMAKVPNDHLKGHLNQIVSLILDHFEEWADELLPTLPKNVWHQIIQEQSQQRVYNQKVFDYLRGRDSSGLNRLDIEEQTPFEKKTPLDIAFSYLKDAGSSKIAIGLITWGAWQMSLSGRQYRNLKQQELPEAFWQAFQTLQEYNSKVNWVVTLEELFPLAKRPGVNTIQGTSGETRLLTETVLRQLNDPHHEITHSRRKVVQVAANGCFAYLKFYPELVGLEEAVGELTRRTIGFGAPYGELFRFPDSKPVWISQGIPGQTLQWVLTKDPTRLTRLDPISTTQLILMAILTNPEDGKPDNYIVEPLPDPHLRGGEPLYRLSCPDNDHGFVPAFVKTKPDKGGVFTKPELVVQVKTILYCLDLMNQPIPEETKALFLTGDPLVLMQGWLDVMDRRNRRYEALYPSKEAGILFKDHQCFMGVPFQKGMISHLYSKWVRFQDCLWEKSLTPLELLNKVEPRLANRYRTAFEHPRNKTVWDRFKWVDGDFYHQQGDHWTTVTASGSILTSQNIPMQESALEAIRKGTDLGPTQAIRELQAIADQKGKEGLSIEHMATDAQREKFLKNFDFGLYAPSEQRRVVNQLVPHAANLRNLILKNCTVLDDGILQNRLLLGDLVCLDLNGCSTVTHDILPTLSQNMPGLAVLNLSNLPKLRWMAKAGLINYDPITFRQLRTLNLSNCTALEAIDLDAPNLKNLWAAGVKKLTLLKIKAAINDDVFYDLLQTLEAPNLKIEKVDFINCPNITKGAKAILSAVLSPQLESLDLSGYQVGAAGTAIVATKTNVETVSISSQDLKHLWTQSQGHIRTVKVKGGITDLDIYDTLLSPATLTAVDLLPTILNAIVFTDCPNITARAKAILQNLVQDLGKALKQGDLGAQHRLGIFFFGLKDYEGCMGWYQKAADQGDAIAGDIMRILGGSKEVFQDYQEAKIVDLMRQAIPLPPVARGYEEIYQRFLKGSLIYRPQQGSDDGRIDLPIAALWNPLESTFDLSLCGDAGEYLSISTGYRKGRRAENADKVEIWLAPRFLIEKELGTTAGHFKKIYGNWKEGAEVGLFWTWGGDVGVVDYDYLTMENMDNLSKNNLYEKWRWNGGVGRVVGVRRSLEKFHVHFWNLNEGY